MLSDDNIWFRLFDTEALVFSGSQLYYDSWLDEIGASMKVQQKLMRCASIQTTLNIYGQAISSSKREAIGKVVEMVLKPLKASA